jgi:cyclic 2,3-diphosphoglycerate synthetase
VVFRPEPLVDVSGRKAFFCTTAPKGAGDVLKAHLEREHGCEVVGMTHHLSDRKSLRTDLESAPEHDVVLVELKAAAVDVAARAAMERKTEVVFVTTALATPERSEGARMGTGIGSAFDRVLERSLTAHPGP